MGYITKGELIEQFKSERIFTTDELTFVEKSLDKDKLNDDAILKLDVTNLFEQKGVLKRFYDFCKKRRISLGGWRTLRLAWIRYNMFIP